MAPPPLPVLPRRVRRKRHEASIGLDSVQGSYVADYREDIEEKVEDEDRVVDGGQFHALWRVYRSAEAGVGFRRVCG